MFMTVRSSFRRGLMLLSGLALLFVMGCDSTQDPEDMITELDDPIGMEDPGQVDPYDEEDDSEEVAESTIPEDIDLGSFERATSVASSDYVLEDNTGYGFAYDASNVFDLDYSTAWCRGDYDTDVDGPYAGGLQLSFASPPAGKTVGIVPGFARDETIFYQNNRVKELVVAYGGALAYSETFTFEDEYAMQFFEWPASGNETTFMLYVTDVYAGSEYDDTCIAEIDFWSDWVMTEDADAAYNYYQQYKADAALRPVGIDEITVSLGSDVMNACGQIDESVLYDLKTSPDWWGYYWKGSGNQAYSYSEDSHGVDYPPSYTFIDWWDHDIVVGAQMNEWAEAGDELTAKFVKIPVSMEDGTRGAGSVVSIKSATVKECADGQLYVGIEWDESDYSGGGSCVFGDCEVQFYFGDRLIGVTPDIQFVQ
jgi:hypothetical protein